MYLPVPHTNVVAIVSYLTGLDIPVNVAALACITLTGRVRAVANLQQKIEALAAYATSLHIRPFKILVPAQNFRDDGFLVEINGSLVRVSNAAKTIIKLVPISSVFDALKIVFQPGDGEEGVALVRDSLRQKNIRGGVKSCGMCVFPHLYDRAPSSSWPRPSSSRWDCGRR